MNMKKSKLKCCLLALSATAAIVPAAVYADNQTDNLRQQVDDLQSQVDRLENTAAERNTDSSFHMAGYGSVEYADPDSGNSAFNKVLVAPIIHYNYQDWLMFETEFELSNTADGDTELALEYASINLFLNDYVALGAGKFLSPIGQFRQNLHPSWINKAVSAPAGFGHGGAAPLTETGLQLRGGFPLGEMRANYAVYVGNGPTLAAAVEGQGGDYELAIEEVETEGRTSDPDGKKSFGGRLGLLPFPGLELGISAAKSKATVTAASAGGHDGPELDIESTGEFDYDVIGADFRYGWNNLELRGEYLKTEIGEGSSGVEFHSDDLPADYAGPAEFDDVEVGQWKAWYLQAAYKIPSTSFEVVVRTSELQTPHSGENFSQRTLGLNYLFAPHVVVKLNYEIKDYDSSGADDDNAVRVQLAYGF